MLHVEDAPPPAPPELQTQDDAVAAYEDWAILQVVPDKVPPDGQEYVPLRAL